MDDRANRRVFDCSIYNGELNVLEIRLHELDDVVDVFVIVESNLTFSGLPKKILFDAAHESIAPFRHKVRHIIVDDMPETNDPWVRETWQRNAMTRGLSDAHENDLVIMSDVDEIPRSVIVRKAVDDAEHSVFFFRLAFFYFYLNYRNIAGPEADTVWNCAATYREVLQHTPQGLRRTNIRTRRSSKMPVGTFRICQTGMEL